MKKLLTLLLIGSTFHVNAMLFDSKDDFHSTSGAVLYFTENQTKYVVLREYYNEAQEFPNVTTFGPLFEWEGNDQKESENEYLKAILSAVALEKAAQYKGARGSQTFTLFTAADESCDCIKQLRYSDFGCGLIVIKELTDFYHCQGLSRFYQNQTTKKLFCLPQAFHETFQKAFFGPVSQDAEDAQK